METIPVFLNDFRFQANASVKIGDTARLNEVAGFFATYWYQHFYRFPAAYEAMVWALEHGAEIVVTYVIPEVDNSRYNYVWPKFIYHLRFPKAVLAVQWALTFDEARRPDV